MDTNPKRRSFGHMNRREIIKAAALLTASNLPIVRTAQAGEGLSERLGLESLSDGALSFPTSFYLPDVPTVETESLLKQHGLAPDSVTPDCNVTLMRSTDRLVLFDTGAGSRFVDSVGLLADSLDAFGVDPGDVTDVVFTHAHPDHLWGVLDDFDDPVFADATHHISKVEWDFWIADATIDLLPEDQKSFAAGAKRHLEAIEDKVVRFDFESEILPGIFAVDTSGHTPGHTSFEIRRDGLQFMVIGDALAHPIISFQKPDWALGTDYDPQKAVATRNQLLGRLVDEKIGFLGYHLTAPGLGHADRYDGAYRFVPAT